MLHVVSTLTAAMGPLTCPATVGSYGAACTAAVLTAVTLPWIGSTFHAAATGIPSNALVLAVTGFAPVEIPLSLVLPQGVSGCDLLVTPDFVDLVLPAAGTAEAEVALPNSASLVGQVFDHQFVPLEFDVLGNLTAVMSSNALMLTIGAF